MIPNTLEELNEIINSHSKPKMLSQEITWEEFGYKVEHYNFSDLTYPNFVLVTYQANEAFIQNCTVNVRSIPSSSKPNEEDVRLKHRLSAENHYLSYCVGRALGLKIPQHEWLFDQKNATYYIARFFLEGVDPFLLTKDEITPDLQKEFNQAIPALVTLGHNDITEMNTISNDQGVHYFDIDKCLRNSSFWRTKAANGAEMLLKKMLNPHLNEDHNGVYGYFSEDVIHFRDTSLGELLKNFTETKKLFNEEKGNYPFIETRGNGVDIQINRRLDACISYLQNKL